MPISLAIWSTSYPCSARARMPVPRRPMGEGDSSVEVAIARLTSSLTSSATARPKYLFEADSRSGTPSGDASLRDPVVENRERRVGERDVIDVRVEFDESGLPNRPVPRFVEKCRERVRRMHW